MRAWVTGLVISCAFASAGSCAAHDRVPLETEWRGEVSGRSVYIENRDTDRKSPGLEITEQVFVVSIETGDVLEEREIVRGYTCHLAEPSTFREGKISGFVDCAGTKSNPESSSLFEIDVEPFRIREVPLPKARLTGGVVLDDTHSAVWGDDGLLFTSDGGDSWHSPAMARLAGMNAGTVLPVRGRALLASSYSSPSKTRLLLLGFGEVIEHQVVEGRVRAIGGNSREAWIVLDSVEGSESLLRVTAGSEQMALDWQGVPWAGDDEQRGWISADVLVEETGRVSIYRQRLQDFAFRDGVLWRQDGESGDWNRFDFPRKARLLRVEPGGISYRTTGTSIYLKDLPERD